MTIKEKTLFAKTLVPFMALFLSILVCNCNQPSSTNSSAPTSSPVTDSTKTITTDGEYTVIRTSKLTTGKATKTYSTKDRKATQFALDLSSEQDKKESFIIKLSNNKVLICNSSNKVLKELKVIKHWTDESGPSTVYDLKDKDGVNYSLDHLIDYQKKNFLAFRFAKSLETYSDED